MIYSKFDDLVGHVDHEIMGRIKVIKYSNVYKVDGVRMVYTLYNKENREYMFRLFPGHRYHNFFKIFKKMVRTEKKIKQIYTLCFIRKIIVTDGKKIRDGEYDAFVQTEEIDWFSRILSNESYSFNKYHITISVGMNVPGCRFYRKTRGIIDKLKDREKPYKLFVCTGVVNYTVEYDSEIYCNPENQGKFPGIPNNDSNYYISTLIKEVNKYNIPLTI